MSLFSKIALRLSIAFIILLNAAYAQKAEIIPSKGYTPQIGYVVAMLENLKQRVINSVENLSLEETDFLLDDEANRIGAMIMHLAATEKFYQVYTFEGREYNEEEKEMWRAALSLGEVGREKLKGKPIDYYLKEWNKVRKETLRLLKTKDDDWFNSYNSAGNMNMYWAWFHVMEHQANHMGQIRLIIKRID